jgi:hypothetical protein
VIGVRLLYRFILFYSHSLISFPPHRSLGLHPPWGRSEPPREPHILGCCPWGEPSTALHPSQGTSSRCLIVSNLTNLYETRNSCERRCLGENMYLHLSFSSYGLAYFGFYFLQYCLTMFLYGDHSLESQNLL